MDLSVTYIRQGGILLLGLLVLLVVGSVCAKTSKEKLFIDFKKEQIHLIHLLVVLLQVFDVPWVRELLSV